MTQISYTQTRWNLNDLFPAVNSPELEAAFHDVDVQVTAFEQTRAQLDEALSAEAFLAIVRQLEQISRIEHRIYAFAELFFSEDTQNQDSQTLLARVEQFFAELSNRTMFFTLWWKDVSDETAERLMAESGDFRYWLEEIRHFKPHTLSEPEEKILNIKNVTGASALNMLYDSITNRYIFKLEVDGKTLELTRGELMVYVRQSDPELRAKALPGAVSRLWPGWPDSGADLSGPGARLAQRTGRAASICRPIAARNLVNDIPDDVVNTLLEVSQRNTGIFQRFFKLKARLLGMERLRRYDIYAPVVHSEKRYDFDQAAGNGV